MFVFFPSFHIIHGLTVIVRARVCGNRAFSLGRPFGCSPHQIGSRQMHRKVAATSRWLPAVLLFAKTRPAELQPCSLQTAGPSSRKKARQFAPSVAPRLPGFPPCRPPGPLAFPPFRGGLSAGSVNSSRGWLLGGQTRLRGLRLPANLAALPPGRSLAWRHLPGQRACGPKNPGRPTPGSGTPPLRGHPQDGKHSSASRA